MTDYSELKRLAEAATRGGWTAGHYKRTPTVFWEKDNGTTPIATVHDLAISGGDYKNDSGEDNCKFIAAANPAVILAILAELDALRDENKRFRSVVKEVLVQLGGPEHDT